MKEFSALPAGYFMLYGQLVKGRAHRLTETAPHFELAQTWSAITIRQLPAMRLGSVTVRIDWL